MKDSLGKHSLGKRPFGEQPLRGCIPLRLYTGLTSNDST